jgi:hypothetical protein
LPQGEWSPSPRVIFRHIVILENLHSKHKRLNQTRRRECLITDWLRTGTRLYVQNSMIITKPVLAHQSSCACSLEKRRVALFSKRACKEVLAVGTCSRKAARADWFTSIAADRNSLSIDSRSCDSAVCSLRFRSNAMSEMSASSTVKALHWLATAKKPGSQSMNPRRACALSGASRTCSHFCTYSCYMQHGE